MNRNQIASITAPGAAVLLALALSASEAAAQSLLERSPNITGAWVGPSGTLHLNFLHRFTVSDAPERSVNSSPTFFVAAGLPWGSLVGFNYATNSDVAPRYPNEWEFLARFAPLSQQRGWMADVAAQAGYNLAAQSVDAELTIGRRAGPVTVRAAARYLSDAFTLGESRAVLAGGGVLRLGQYVAVAGDYATMLARPEGYDDAWSAALQLAIPFTPHTLSLQATNANTATLQGSSGSRGGLRRYGFEFTIPVTLSRYIPRRTQPAAAIQPPGDDLVVVDTVVRPGEPLSEPQPAATPPTPATPAPEPARPDTVLARSDTAARPARGDTVRPAPVRTSRPASARPRAVVVRAEMKSLKYTPSRIEITAGSTVVWTNSDPLAHTVTSDDRRWDSGLIELGKVYSRHFDQPGTYHFHCTPHPFMKGVVVVR